MQNPTVETNPQWRQENTLTSPADRDHSKKEEYINSLIDARRTPPLTNDELDSAMKDLALGTVYNYPVADRAYSDPPVPFQRWFLWSFVPAKGAKPDKDGVYGMGKMRYVSDRPEDMDAKEEELIRNVDSFHTIQRGFVGRPFPVTVDTRFCEEVKEIDLAKKTTQVMSESIKSQKREDLKEIEEIKQREENLRQDVAIEPEDVDPMETYTTLVVKKAQLSFTFLEHFKKLEEIKDIIVKTRKQIIDMDEKNPEYRKNVKAKYMSARRQVSLPDDDKSFLSLICEDVTLPFDRNPGLFDNVELGDNMVTPQPRHDANLRNEDEPEFAVPVTPVKVEEPVVEESVGEVTEASPPAGSNTS